MSIGHGNLPQAEVGGGDGDRFAERDREDESQEVSLGQRLSTDPPHPRQRNGVQGDADQADDRHGHRIGVRLQQDLVDDAAGGADAVPRYAHKKDRYGKANILRNAHGHAAYLKFK